MPIINLKRLTAIPLIDYIGPPFPTLRFDGRIVDGKLQVKRKKKEVDLKAINKNQLQGGKYFMQLSLMHKGVRFNFPNEPLVSISLTKTIVKTATVGSKRQGTVKEFINAEDYNITIQGVCYNEADMQAYPSEWVQELLDIVAVNEALDVKSNLFFELFGIRKIVIEDISFDEMQGNSGVQSYNIKAVSDSDFYADLNEKDKEKTNFTR